MFEKIGNFVVKNRIWIIVGWVLIALAMFFFAPSLSEVGTMKESTFLPSDSESLRARELIEEYFPESKAGSTVSLVFYNPDGLNNRDMEYAKEVRNWFAGGEPSFEVENVVSVFDNPQLKSQLISPDKTTMLLNAGLEQVAFESESQDTTREIREYLESAPEGLEVYVSGSIGIYSDVFEYLSKSIDLTTIITVILIIVLLLIIYRSPVAALVPLLTIGVTFMVARGVLGLIGSAGVSIWSQIDVFLIVLVFGIGTDYCLFLVSRFREELGKGHSRSEAMKLTVGNIGKVITASAVAVIVGLAGMAVARYQMIQTMGPVLGIAIFITLLAALTLTPALASLFGKKLFWPRHAIAKEKRNNTRPGFWERVAKFSTGKPVIVIAIVVVLMLVPYLAIPGMNRSFDQIAEIPSSAESVSGFRILEEHYDVGEMDPLNTIVVAPEGTKITEASSLNALVKMGRDLNEVEGVVKVQSIVQPDGSGQVPEELTVAGQLGVIGEGVGSALEGGDTGQSGLSVDDFDTAYAQLDSYFLELEQNFDWIKKESSYQHIRTGLNDISMMLEEIGDAARVENQLNLIGEEFSKINLSQSSFGEEELIAASESIDLLKLYLEELAAEHPSVKSEASYNNAYENIILVQDVIAKLPTASLNDIMGYMVSLPKAVDNIGEDIQELADKFKGSDAVLYSSALMEAFPESSALPDIQSRITSFQTNLDELSNEFRERDNPMFLSSTLMDADPDTKDLLNLFISEDERAARLYVVISAYPQSDAALSTVTEAREAIKDSTQGTALEGAEVVIGGTSAELTDVRQILDEDFNRVLIVVIVAILIVLIILLRSLVAPLYLLATVLLSYGTTLGIVSWIFQGLLGQDGISFMIPIIVFVLLVALGSDYNIFLMSRVKEESHKVGNIDAARLAAIATGGVITACGIILAGTFGVLVITPIRTMVQIGAAVAIGVLIDTFLVRALLVPAIASLLKKWNWWPSKNK
jgi:RND superfamily putative drug exporter